VRCLSRTFRGLQFSKAPLRGGEIFNFSKAPLRGGESFCSFFSKAPLCGGEVQEKRSSFF